MIPCLNSGPRNHWNYNADHLLCHTSHHIKCKFCIIYTQHEVTTTTTTSVKWPFSRTSWVSQQQKGKPFWILLEKEMMWWQWHQLYHMQIICTSLQTDNHASTSPFSFTHRMPFLPPNQQCQSTDGKEHEVRTS